MTATIAAAGGKQKEEELWPLDMDKVVKKGFIEKFGYSTITTLGDQ